MKILILTPSLPSTQKQTGADICLQAFTKALQENGYTVTTVGFLRIGESLPQPNEEFISVGSCHVETKEAKLYPLLWASKSFLRNLPYTSARYYSKQYIKKVQELLSQNSYEAIILDHSYQIAWLEPFIAEKHKIVSIAQNIECEVYADRVKDAKNIAAKWLYSREAKLIQSTEEHLTRTSKETWALTDNDAKYFSGIEGAGKIRVMGLPSSLGDLPDSSIEKTFDIGLIGSWIWKPNGDGLRWFFKEVYPYLPKRLRIEVAGRGAEWLDGQYPNVNYQGFAPDAKVFMAQSKVIAIPSICGGGIQIKTLNSIGLGLPIVATPFAMRGISNPPSFVKVTNDPKKFADLLVAGIDSNQSTSSAAKEALDWSKERKQIFLRDIREALNEISEN
ncbi:glycosyltransferase family 4 protein [Pseudanabaena sp. FACHB-2040]|uniref:glycosyltransferase n=1 Tax=Pseudanabaena sp. FACHB-2040 TaxID=2692859 RepID=UPI001683CD95|nr:glycosyltransferase family 4 protein [Pseudanabaena sp. FACHB-2040]MBD2260593.1 glycosyltransferase [Pseudanabaena sp. FACHB-2040]